MKLRPTLPPPPPPPAPRFAHEVPSAVRVMSGMKLRPSLPQVPSAVHVMDAPRGALLTRMGDVRDESFVVLRGELEVAHRAGPS